MASFPEVARALSSVKPASDGAPGEPLSSTLLVERSVMIPMRDGVELAADIYRPSGSGPSPVLLQRTPYGKSNAKLAGDLIFNPLVAAERGYAVVIQDVRGRMASGGLFEPFVNEVADGYDSVEWAAAQPWSSGAVGVYGASFTALLALYAAVAAPPHLRAAFTYLTAANLHDGWTYTGGALELGFVLRLARVLAADTVARSRLPSAARTALQEGLGSMPARARSVAETLPLTTIEELSPPAVAYWRKWLSHPAYDEYWAAIDVTRLASNLKVPVLQVCGWYDLFLRGGLDLNARFAEHPEPDVRDESRLLVGPWDHGAYMSLRTSSCGDEEFGSIAAGAAAGMSSTAMQWFDRWLLDRPTPLFDTPRVRYFRLGENRWIDTDAWPPAHPMSSLFLHSRGAANSRSGDGTLTLDPPALEPPDRFVYDPRNPVPTVGGRCMQPEFGQGGILDQSVVEQRDDILVYTTVPLDADVIVEGPVRVELFASTDGVDTDFTAKLVDVRPGGYCAIVADGILRARFREDPERAKFLEPNEIALLRIELLDIAYSFGSGHRIRLEISSSNFPRFDRNLNIEITPALGLLADARRAEQTVFHDRAHASRLVLPIGSGLVP